MGLYINGHDTDFLVMISGIGCVVSSAITLVVRTFSQECLDHVIFIYKSDLLPEVY